MAEDKKADANQASSGASVMDEISPELKARITEELGSDELFKDFSVYFAKKKATRENRETDRWAIYLVQNSPGFAKAWSDAKEAGKTRMAAGDDLKTVKASDRKARSEARKQARKEAQEKAEKDAVAA